MTLKNNKAPFLYYFKFCASSQCHQWIQTGVTVQKRSIRVKVGNFWSLMTLKFDRWPWRMSLKNNRAPFLYYAKLCASFQSHRWIQIGVTVRKRLIQVKIGNLLSCVTLKFDGWPWKTMGYLFYATPSFVHHFKPIDEFKLELHSGNAQFGTKSTIIYPVWPWNLTDNLEKQ